MNERDMSLIKAVSEAVREQLLVLKKIHEGAIAGQADEIKELKITIDRLQKSAPNEEAISQSVLAMIEVPAAPELPDIQQMVSDAVGQIKVPEVPPLPDIEGMVRDAVSAIKLPQPEPLPNIQQMVKDAIDEIPVPTAPALPDIEGLIRDAVAAVEIPEPEKLPDIQHMVQEAVSAMPVPQAPELPELPDIEGLIREAVADIKIPEPELPDIHQLVKEAVSALPQAKDGEPGEDGRDALQIEILPHVDQGKSYPRGTYAIHQGGLWRAYQKTTGMNGWECLVDGLSSMDIAQDEERTFTVTAVKSSGEKTSKRFSVPVMIYRDIFKDGEKYVPGDSVTWGGSVWYCHEETGDKPGEAGSKGWKLAVKRGRDARSKP